MIYSGAYIRQVPSLQLRHLVFYARLWEMEVLRHHEVENELWEESLDVFEAVQ